MDDPSKSNKFLPQYNPAVHIPDESILKEILNAAMDVSVLDKKNLKEKIEHILNLRIDNELMITQLLKAGVENDQIAIEEAAKINNKSKDSLSDLVKTKQLLEGLPTEKLSVNFEDHQFSMERLNRMKSSVGEMN